MHYLSGRPDCSRKLAYVRKTVEPWIKTFLRKKGVLIHAMMFCPLKMSSNKLYGFFCFLGFLRTLQIWLTMFSLFLRYAGLRLRTIEKTCDVRLVVIQLFIYNYPQWSHSSALAIFLEGLKVLPPHFLQFTALNPHLS